MKYSVKLHGGNMKPVVKRIIIVGIVIAALAGIIIYNLIPDDVDVELAEMMRIEQSISEMGYIEADPAVLIYAPVAGKLSKISYKVNDIVKTGDCLAGYDLIDAQDRYNKAELSLEYYEDAYKAAVDENNKNKSKAYSSSGKANELLAEYVHIEENRDDISIRQNSWARRVDQTRQGIEAEISRLQSNLEIETVKLENGEGSVEEVDKIRKSLTESYEALASIPPTDSMPTEQFAQYAEYSRQMELADKRWSDEMTKKTAAEEKIVTEASLKQYEDSVKLARADEQIAAKNLSNAKKGVISTVSGTVMERLVDEGAVCDEGTTLFVIQPDSGYKASLMVSRYDIENVALGQKAKIQVGAKEYDGTVSAISPVATTSDATGKPKVKVEISFDDNTFAPTIGLEVQVKIFTRNEENVIGIPEKAVYTDDAGSYVYVLKQGKAVKQTVKTGIQGQGYAQIMDGISEGDTVITSPLSEEDEGGRFAPSR